MSPHTASQKYSFDWMHVSFPASSPLQGLQRWQFPQNPGSKKEPLLATPLYGELHLHIFPRICWRSSGRRKVRVVVDRPAFVELRVLTRTSTAWKIPTHTSGSRRPSFSVLMLRPQELWSLKKLPFTIFAVHATTWKWLSLDSRRLWGFQSSCHATCKQRRAWQGAGGQQLGRFRRKFFFLCIFRKSYARGRRETKKITTVALQYSMERNL